ncbi:MAG TPA: hypothetical protein DCO86_01375 [Spirochaetaceae bacterium]|nr:hypothetical protein [Spirochaetaceae bacterium]
MDIKTEEQPIAIDSRMSKYRTDTVTVVAFLLGVRDDQLKNEHNNYNQERLKRLEADSSARDLRCLTTLRQQLMWNCNKIVDKRKASFHLPLDSAPMGEFVNLKDIEYLKNRNIDVINVGNNNLMCNIAVINQYISDRIGNLRNLFYDWINFEYIKSLFIMPGCSADKKALGQKWQEMSERIYAIRTDYVTNNFKYPFKTFLTWPKPFEDNGDGGNALGNVLKNDGWFLRHLYEANGDEFTAAKYVIDAPQETKQLIYDFVNEATNISVAVDCENASPYSLAGCLLNLDPEQIGKVRRIILIDDVHTSSAWDIFQEVLNKDERSIAVERMETTRIKEEKSLVDMTMAMRISKEHYEGNADSIILVSSDSDFWVVIKSLEKAHFLVLNERLLTSQRTIDILDEHAVKHCFMDTFAQDERVQRFKQDVLYRLLSDKIKDFNATGCWGEAFLDADSLVNEFFRQAYIKGADDQMKRERDAFKNKYLKNGFTFEMTDNGSGSSLVLDFYRKKA